MKFGVLLTAVWGRHDEPKVQLAQHREMVELSEQLGFRLMVAGQHFLGAELRYYQPVPYLTYMSRFAPKMEVATGIVLMSLVNPVELAEQICTLDACTDGKAILGIGLGYAEAEFRAAGIPRETRIKRFEEGLELIKELWSGKEHIKFDGDLFKVDGDAAAVQPVRRPRPPIWIGGQGEKAIRRAARMADAWYAPPFPTHEGLARLREVFLEERAKHGLPDNGFPVRRELIIAGSRAEARELAKQRSAARYEIYLKWGLGNRLDADNAGFGSEADEDIDARFILGAPEDVAEQLDGIRTSLGMDCFVFKPQWLGLPHAEAMKQVELFGTKVLPLLEKAEAASKPAAPAAA
ncbi:LLM class flavin-dependent oxidoreductase [Sphingomonas immobilis]|uniref:LLM class flavin-dependent oxidoreductase n=1 Tax=Sphingomonas immobilis TaxID=3063997 RepID=A0ABT9A357_9SPHN|nr:LLM class flavin-dependent oxidoreductase [Sphingomonas sp. CA1-15]MDO7843172.1 LLM class flavin-dependent oxidoreductase [Sphingomonas sp. CA1-15]